MRRFQVKSVVKSSPSDLSDVRCKLQRNSKLVMTLRCALAEGYPRTQTNLSPARGTERSQGSASRNTPVSQPPTRCRPNELRNTLRLLGESGALFPIRLRDVVLSHPRPPRSAIRARLDDNPARRRYGAGKGMANSCPSPRNSFTTTSGIGMPSVRRFALVSNSISPGT